MSVLIIDDDEPLIEVLRAWLGDRPIRVAHSLAAAREELAQHSPDHILLDLGLPDSTPAQTVERIKTLKLLSPRAVVIVVTGWPGHEAAARAAGADGFVQKGSVALAADLKRELRDREKESTAGE
jgi:CheY-like chemotaxis protein